MALTHHPNSEYTYAPHQVLVANPHLHGSAYDRKVALVVAGGRGGFRGIEVNRVFRQSLLAAQNLTQAKRLSRLFAPKHFELGVIDWAPGELEEEIRSGVWMPTISMGPQRLAVFSGWAETCRATLFPIMRALGLPVHWWVCSMARGSAIKIWAALDAP